MLEARVLGKFEVKHGNKVINIPSRPAQTLLAYLILSAGTSHRREKLAGMLWPDSLEETARDNLRHALWRIRKALESASSTRFLHADDISISFSESSEYWLDAAELESLGDGASADTLKTVLSNYHGELLPGFYEEWVILEREHLYSIFEHHMARLMSLLENEQRWLDTLEWGERWIKLGQKPEPAYRALMTAHAAKGDMSKVAATYERCVKSLREYSIEPSEQTKELYKNLKVSKEIHKTVPASTKPFARETSSSIPVPLTSFIGREEELKEISKLLSTSRLLTLTGPGGVGKTRLAIQTAHDSIKKFKDGVCWVELVGLRDGSLIPQEIAQALDMREVSNQPMVETLKTHLKSKELLLVLDNCEHLIRGCALYTEQLLVACPRLKILATSIEALGLFNEITWQVPSLPLPKVQELLSSEKLQTFASIELFVERAHTANLNFVLSTQNSKSVAQICNRLDGIPLAIELAAARTKVLSVDEIAVRLDDRFSLLTAGSRTAIPRHQTLRATIDWSYDLLTEPERMLFRRLAVFAGGFTLDAAEAVCSQRELKRNDILDVLGRLVDKSLVVVEQESATGETRYRLLETIRHYALEKLIAIGEAPDIRDRHLHYYLELAEISEPKLMGSEYGLWFRRLDIELDNIRAAIDWSTNTGKAQAALRIAGSLSYFWFSHRQPSAEWREWIQKALARSEGKEQTLARAKALNAIGFMYFADFVPTDLDRRSEIEEALRIGREFNDPWNTATALRTLGLLENIRGNYSAARAYLEQSLVIWRQMGITGKFGQAWSLVFLGDVALNLGQVEEARSLYEEVVSMLRQTGDLNFLAYAVRRLAQLLWRDGEYKKATALCKESLNLNEQVGSPRGVVACLAGFAAIAMAQQDYRRAAQIMATVGDQITAFGIRLVYIDQQEYERNLARLREELDEKALAKAWAKGSDMSLEQAITFALGET